MPRFYTLIVHEVREKKHTQKKQKKKKKKKKKKNNKKKTLFTQPRTLLQTSQA